MDNFIEEVDEELKRARQLELWRKYGKYAVGAVLLVVITVAGGVGWRQYQANVRTETGLQFTDAVALAANGKTEQALAAFRALGKDGAAGYRELSRFQEAALLARKGNEPGAAAVYDAIANDESVDPLFRNLSLLLYALNVADRAEPKALSDRLKTLAENTSPWRFSALEVTALLHRRRGDVAAAKSIYKQLADDPAAPPRLRARAAEFIALLGK
jgi:hypothetical protein